MASRIMSRRGFLRASALLSAMALTAACAPAAKPAEQATSAPQVTVPPATEKPKEAKKIKITMWFHDFLYVQFFTDHGKEWAGQHPEYEITWDIAQIPGIADKFIGTLVAGSGSPDLIGIEQGWMPRLFKGGLAEKGMYDLNPWLDLEGADFKKKFLRWELYSYQGKTYGCESALCPTVYYYRKDVLDEAGLDPSKWETYDQFVEAGMKLYKDKQKYLMPADTVDGGYYLMYMLQNDGNFFNEKGDVVLDSKEVVDSLEWYVAQAKTNNVAFATSEFWGQGLTAAIKDGTCAGVNGADWYSDYVLKKTYEELKGKWAAAECPAFKAGGRRTSVNGGTGMGVCKQSANADATWQILKWCYLTRENQVKRYLEIHYFPNMVDALTDKRITDAKDDFFGGQQLGALLAKVSPSIPMYYASPFKAEALDILNKEIMTPVMAGEKKPKDAVADATKSLKDIIAKGV